MLNKFSPALFVLAFFCFFMPFITVSCQGQKVMSLTGIQLVTGTTVQQPGTAQSQKIGSEKLAIFVFISVIAGIGVSFWKAKKKTIVSAVIGGVGAILLLLLKSKLDNDIMREGQGVLQIEYALGFWLVFLFNLLATVLNGVLFSQGRLKTDAPG